jgi:hypothetical protein
MENQELISKVDDLAKRVSELEDHFRNFLRSGQEGPTHASSAGMHNYPQVPPQTERQQKQQKTKQPLSGAAATAEQH